MTQDSMRRWLLPADESTPEALRLETVDRPQPGPHEVLVRVAAISINARDALILTTPFGRIPGQDLVPLSDVAGVIDSVGDGVTAWRPGDRVTDLHNGLWNEEDLPRGGSIGPGSLNEPGVLAEYVVLPEERLLRVPDDLTLAAASTVPVAGVTAWHAVFEQHSLSTADTVLVVGSGGVAVYALQLAKAAGARVIAGVRNPDKGERMRQLGADEVVLTTEADWGAALFGRTGGATRIIDSVGPKLLDQYLAAVAVRGEIMMLGLYETAPVPLDYFSLIGKLATIRGIAVGSGRMERDLLAFLHDHAIEPVIDTRVRFDAAPDAYRALGAPGLVGKIVIETGEDR